MSYPFRDLPFTRTEVTNLAAQIPDTDVLIDQAFSRGDTEAKLGIATTSSTLLPTEPCIR